MKDVRKIVEEANSPLKANLFALAPRELSHSAFVGWLLECARADSGPAGAAGRAVWKMLGMSESTPIDEVYTERRLQETGWKKKGYDGKERLDIFAITKAGSLGIEMKVGSRASVDQLSRYTPDRHKSKNSLVFLSFNFRFDKNRKSIVNIGTKAFDVYDFLRAVERFQGGGSEILDSHIRWLQHETRRVDVWRDVLTTRAGCLLVSRMLNGEDSNWTRDNRQWPGIAARAQWAAMRTIADSIKWTGWRHADYNRPSGQPWTQYKLRLATTKDDALFFRMDRRKAGPYFALVAHNGGHALSKRRHHRTAEVQKAWRNAALGLKADLHDTCNTYRRPKSNERHIVRYILGDGSGKTNRWDVVQEWVPKIFAEFVKTARIKRP